MYPDFMPIFVVHEHHARPGTVVIWDRGTYKLLGGGIDSGRIEFLLKGKKLKGIFVLTRMKGKDKEWLLIKKRDEYADAHFKLQTVLTE